MIPKIGSVSELMQVTNIFYPHTIFPFSNDYVLIISTSMFLKRNSSHLMTVVKLIIIIISIIVLS